MQIQLDSDAVTFCCDEGDGLGLDAGTISTSGSE